ncbi:MAG: hypothetical protein FJ147_19810 [Deltaproteobacteria bacterium]|nr:hypothetical protein [Deltaproteobacteria bacterium]
MQARMTKSFLAALSLFGVLSLPAAASAHSDEDYYGNRRNEQRELYNAPHRHREHLQLHRTLKRNYQDHYNRYSYKDEHTGRWRHDGHWHDGNTPYPGKSCQLPRPTSENNRQYRPRYYGNDYYGYAR